MWTAVYAVYTGVPRSLPLLQGAGLSKGRGTLPDS